MPVNYLVEMVMDRIAACKVYRGKDYTDASAWEYYHRERPYLNSAMHTEAARRKDNVFLFAETFEKRKLLVRMVYHDP